MPNIVYSSPAKTKSSTYLFFKYCRHISYHALVNVCTAIADFIGIDAFFNRLFFQNLKQNNKLALLRQAVFSGNALIASLGLNFAYVVVNVVTLWGAHLAIGAAVSASAALSLLLFPVVAYLALAISDAINEIKRNLVYERLKEKKREKIKTLEGKIQSLLTVDITLTVPDHYKKLNTSTKTQAAFEALKKSSRTLALFTIILALEWAVGISTGIFIGSVITGSIILVVDFRAQRKVSNHDLKIREMNQKIALLRAKYVQLKQEEAKKSTPTHTVESTKQQITQSNLITLLSNDITTRPSKPSSIWWNTYIAPYWNVINAALKPHLLKIDNLLAIIGITSGYVAFSLITIFATHEHLLEAGSALVDGLLYGIPSLIAAIIGVINIYANGELHTYYKEEKQRLEAELTRLKADTIDMMSRNSFEPKVQGELNNYFNHTSEDPWIEEYCQAPKKWYKEKEAAKKLLRILTMSFLFLGAGLLSPTGIGIVIALAIVVAGLDYYVRSGKEEKEAELKELQKQQLKLLKVQEILADNIVAPETEGAISLHMPLQKAPDSGLVISIAPSGSDIVQTHTTTANSSPTAIADAESTQARPTSQQADSAVAAKIIHNNKPLISSPLGTSTLTPLLNSYSVIKAEHANGIEQATTDELDAGFNSKHPPKLNIQQANTCAPSASLLLHTWQKPSRRLSTPALSARSTLAY